MFGGDENLKKPEKFWLQKNVPQVRKTFRFEQFFDFVVRISTADLQSGARWAFSCPRGLLRFLPTVGRQSTILQQNTSGTK